MPPIILTVLEYESPLSDAVRPSVWPAAAALFAAVGVLLAWRAYRRWLVADLG
jgi:hypothetical protein